MRLFVAALAGCVACAHAPAPIAQATPACPSPDSIRAERARSAAPTAGIHETPRHPRYLTYVVDSQYVLLADQAASDSMIRNPLRDLAVADIAAIYALKEQDLPSSWRTCPGVPVMLILTSSKHWRPRTLEPRTPD